MQLNSNYKLCHYFGKYEFPFRYRFLLATIIYYFWFAPVVEVYPYFIAR